MSFTTTVDGWLGELSKQLDAYGYTQALHDALLDVQTHMEKETVSQGYEGVFLKSPFVTQKPKLVPIIIYIDIRAMAQSREQSVAFQTLRTDS